ncbi:MAG: iron reductase, partial [Mycobacterium sp.]
PQLASVDELTAMRRGQAVLDALVGFGLPVRGLSAPRRRTRANTCEIRAAFPMLLASSD